MSEYGRNFEFRVPPLHGQRAARFSVPTTGNRIQIGAPVRVDGAAGLDAGGRQIVALATGATVPVKGQHGIMVFEYGPAAFAGVDPQLTTYSDLDQAPLGAAVQIVSGPSIKVVLRNTAALTYLNTRTYAAKNMVAAADLAAAAVGTYLTPGTGDTTAGFWAAGTAANGWLVVTKVDTTRGEIEAVLNF